jgi:Tol biopolymer transport system component
MTLHVGGAASRIGLAAVLGAASMTAAMGIQPAPADAAFPGANGRIAFSSDRLEAGYFDIWTMAADGSDFVRLTYSPLADFFATWSPGGTSIAFTRYNSPDLDDGEIWIMKADGSGLKRLTNNAADDTDPTFSPDGARIAFSSNRDGDYEIYVMNVDGSQIVRTTNNVGITDAHAAWSPKGDKLAFASDRDGSVDIWTMKPDGSSTTNITMQVQPVYYFHPDWSPDGTAILYEQFWFTGTDWEHALVYDILGNSNTLLPSPHDGYDEFPVISPDGQYWIWDSNRANPEGSSLFITGADGFSPSNLSNAPSSDVAPDWQPIPAFPLVDARFSTFKADIEWVFGEGITSGCSPERYCPTSPVTRGQMASFLARAMDLPPTATDYFSDDNGTTHEANINRIAAAGITTGCAPGLYCPTGLVTRGQMASFLARALELPNTATDYFSDDNGTTHENNINRLAAAAITTGCSPTTYCPTANVTRGQMAAFLHRAFGP